MRIIDARGKEHPTPETMTEDAIKSGEKEIKIIVDNPVAGQNVSKILKDSGFTVSLEAENDLDIGVSGVFESAPQASEPCPAAEPGQSEVSEPRTVLIAKTFIGADRDHGETLMKDFLGTLHQLEQRYVPDTLILMNEGVKLALDGSSTCDDLIKLENRGCRIILSEACISRFNLADYLGAGEVTDIASVWEILLKAPKVLSL